MNSESKKRCLVYGGTSGVGLEVSRLLATCGYIVDATGRNNVESFTPRLTFHSISPSEANFCTENRSFLLKRAVSTALCVFNVGGSFGHYEKIASVRTFNKLSLVNSIYIIDTIEAFEEMGLLKDLTLVFILTNALRSSSGNPTYLMHKAAIEKYAEYLAINCKEKNLRIVTAYPPLLLYPWRHLPQLFMSLSTEDERRKFVEERLFGDPPVLPNSFALHLVSEIRRVQSLSSSISNVFKIYADIN